MMLLFNNNNNNNNDDDDDDNGENYIEYELENAYFDSINSQLDT